MTSAGVDLGAFSVHFGEGGSLSVHFIKGGTERKIYGNEALGTIDSSYAVILAMIVD